MWKGLNEGGFSLGIGLIEVGLIATLNKFGGGIIVCTTLVEVSPLWIELVLSELLLAVLSGGVHEISEEKVAKLLGLSFCHLFYLQIIWFLF